MPDKALTFAEMHNIAKTYNDLKAKREKLAKESCEKREFQRVEALREALANQENVKLLNLMLGEKRCAELYGHNGGFRELMDYNVANIEFDVRVVEFEHRGYYPSAEDYTEADKELGIEA